MTAIVIVPYSPSPLRAGPFATVLAHLDKLPWPYWVATDDQKPFRLARTMNREIAKAAADILILHAADTVTPVSQMEEAVKLAEAEPGLVFAYDRYVRLNEDGTVGRTLKDTPAHACTAIRRECFLEIGGYDEAYVGWGMEDKDFNRRAEKLWPTRRVPGYLVHHWHGDRRRDDSDLETPPETVKANWRRYRMTG